MRLLIDIGNQRLKWITSDLLAEARNCPAQAIESQVERLDQQLDEHFGKLQQPQSIWICSVSKQDIKDKIVIHALQNWGVLPRSIESSRQLMGVTNHYANIKQLGVDRWAAVIGARSLLGNKGIVVVDVGTAVTMDYVDEQGNFRGGVIFPGIRTMKKALNTQTEKITITPFQEPLHLNHQIVMANIDTESAVANGASLAVVSAIESGIERLQALSGQLEVIMTGGDSKQISSMMNREIHLEENLVLLGTDIIARQESLQ